MRETDSDALAAGLFTEQLISTGTGSGFSWNDYSDIAVRYKVSQPSTMRSSMAAEFDGTNYLEIDTPAATAYDFTLCCWIKTGALAAVGTVMSVYDKDTSTDICRLAVDGTSVYAISRSSTSGGQKTATESTIDPDDGSKHFIGATFQSATSRTAWGDSNSTDNTDTVPITNAWDRTTIGAVNNTGALGAFIGEASDAYVFSPALTADEVAYMVANEPSYADLVSAYAAGTTDCPDPDNVAAYWPLTEHTLSRSDLSGNGLTLAEGGTNPVLGVAGFIDRVPQVEDRALSFDGVDQKASSATSDFRSADSLGSIAAWIKTSANDHFYWTSSNTASANHFLTLGVDASGYPVLSQASGGATQVVQGPSTVDDGDWHLVIWKSDGTNYYCSVDGGAFVLETGDGDWLAETTTRNTVDIGVWDTTGTDIYWDGEVANIMYFSSALSDTDASELWAAGAGVLGKHLTADTLTSGTTSIHVWNLSKNNAGGAGEDVGTTGGVDLTLSGTTNPTDTPGIPEGQRRNGQVRLIHNVQNVGTNDATQATLANRPELVYVSDGTGYGLRFDGVDDSLTTAAYGTALSQPNTIMAVVESSVATSSTICDGLGTANEHRVAQDTSAVRLDAGTSVLTTTGFAADTLLIITAIMNGASSKAYADGGTPDTVDAGAETMTGLTLGSVWFATNLFDGTMREIVVNDGALTSDQLDQIHLEWSRRYGITVTAVS